MVIFADVYRLYSTQTQTAVNVYIGGNFVRYRRTFENCRKDNTMIMIRLEEGQGGSYRIVNVETDEDILILSSYDLPSIAITFGWDGDDGEIDFITLARKYLDDNIGKETQDPGYWGGYYESN